MDPTVANLMMFMLGILAVAGTVLAVAVIGVLYAALDLLWDELKRALWWRE